MNAERLLAGFLQYVRMDTTANEATESYPSSTGQRDLGALLVRQLDELGLADAHQDEHGLVWATIPATVAGDVPVVAFNAHLDTSPETSGANVKPQVIRNYGGGDIVLPGDPQQVIRVAENPALQTLRGATLITADGTTLLGSDDKAGVAVIMEMAAHLMEHSGIRHGPIRVLFTCDEEIGRGVKHVDLDKLGASVCYTLDGSGAGEIDVETFSADLAIATVRGVNIHPSIAKGRMVNAVRAMSEFVARLPQDRLSPETTDQRDGFIHPYHVTGGVGQAAVKLILRDFDTARLAEHADLLRASARQVEGLFPGVKIDVEVTRQYRNMGEGLSREPRAVDYAELAHRRLGRTARRTIVRGGTDGSLLTEKGLPTPNLSTGQHNPHSRLEWACLDEMVQAAEVLVELVQVWAEPFRFRNSDSVPVRSAR
ncbi:MAG TPA: peptidase T [Candidatus Anammoximicrobium sp.]|nr:peptidase T [Candidatus Anammoximicrobium sp.]